MAETPGKSGLPAPVKTPSEETLQKLLDVQTKDLVLRGRELDLRKDEIAHNAKFAEKALEAQVQDRRDSRQHQRRQSMIRYLASGGFGIVVLVFCSWALYLNKDVIVMEGLKIIGQPVLALEAVTTSGEVGQLPVGNQQTMRLAMKTTIRDR